MSRDKAEGIGRRQVMMALKCHVEERKLSKALNLWLRLDLPSLTDV